MPYKLVLSGICRIRASTSIKPRPCHCRKASDEPSNETRRSRHEINATVDYQQPRLPRAPVPRSPRCCTRVSVNKPTESCKRGNHTVRMTNKDTERNECFLFK
ncbi:LOW QUALITY PROTEIN: hypothetical protein PHMEG_0004941 [Phytophthora megakarya]|uniref:Uncharacterized protein n=1 Tax=Phytophthora megakarya TaxID=4795 RepID=A0A225WU64_9STRA|nr:LOW QUALITY PROTEIN: hypothetical protein PHMEG_0004941 [Phytophthora megakarya]